MKKALIAVFSISITAGTLYLTYSQVKDYFIKKLVKSWTAEATKQKKELSEQQIKQLKEELDKLYLWQVKQIANYSDKLLQGSPANETAPLLAKLNEKKILEKVNLKAIEGIVPFTVKTT